MSGTDLVPAGDLASIEVDPVQHMSVVLNRAKGWLQKARSIDDARELKALAVGYESVLREKELAFDAQLAATEIVRRCERRIGELVREGQQEGVIRKPGDDCRTDLVGRDQLRPQDAAGVADRSQVSPLYALADAPAEQFEHAIAEAKEEGNLSRANVVRKVKRESPSRAEQDESAPPAKRSEWHHKRRRIDSNRILSTLAQDLDAAISGLELMEADTLDPELVAQCVPAIRRSISTIRDHLKRIQR